MVSWVSLCSASILSRSSEVSRRKRQIEDRLGLNLGERELAHQTGACGLGVLRRANQLDHRVEVLERDQQAVEDVQARLGLAQFELRAPRQHAGADGRRKACSISRMLSSRGRPS